MISPPPQSPASQSPASGPLSDQRHLFDVPEDVAYFNCASRTPFLTATVEAADAGVRTRLTPWSWTPAPAVAAAEDVRTAVARLISCGDEKASADDIALAPAVSYAMALIARNVSASGRIEDGSAILVLEDQFPSNVYAWRHLAADTGARLITVPRPADGDWTAAVLERLDRHVSLAALPPCHWTDGGLLDMAAIGRRCREIDAVFVVDATQWIGARPFDIGAVKPDYLAAAAYKWLFGPYSLAYLYVAPEHQSGWPIEHHTYNHQETSNHRATGPVMAAGVGYPETFTAGARRFDMGEVFNPISLPAARAALDQVLAWGAANVTEALAPITETIAKRAEALGFLVPPAAHRVGHFIGIHRRTPPPEGLLDALAEKGVYAALRGGRLRLSPHIFITEADVARLFSALSRLWPR